MIYNDIRAIDVVNCGDMNKMMGKFHTVMRTHGICKNTRGKNGSMTINPEWDVCLTIFREYVSSVITALDFKYVPGDLEYYE